VLRLSALRDRIRSSLFWVPMLFVVGGAVLGQVALEVDSSIDGIPAGLTATVDSARAVLQVVAGATLSFAGVAFSVSLLLISLASSQYSPRVVHGLFRDPFNKRIMGVVVGTFTYCLMVLRAVRGPLEDSGSAPVVPSLSIALAVVLGVVAILSIVAFISHSAHSMDVSRILERVTEETLAEVRTQWPEGSSGPEQGVLDVAGDAAFTVRFHTHGWVQQIDVDGLLDAAEPNAIVHVETVAGRYAITGTPICRVVPAPSDPDGVAAAITAAVTIGPTRTMQNDVTYGVRQLADVALKALSPGINDPTTAQDAIFHMGAVVGELLRRRPPDRRRDGDDGRVVYLHEGVTHADVVELAFDEIRLAAQDLPSVQVYLLEVLRLLRDAVEDPDVVGALTAQADRIRDDADRTDASEEDRDRIREAHRRRFG
jgi:uncharacterized membrane protein